MKYSCINVFSVNSGWNETAIVCFCLIAITNHPILPKFLYHYLICYLITIPGYFWYLNHYSKTFK